MACDGVRAAPAPGPRCERGERHGPARRRALGRVDRDLAATSRHRLLAAMLLAIGVAILMLASSSAAASTRGGPTLARPRRRPGGICPIGAAVGAGSSAASERRAGLSERACSVYSRASTHEERRLSQPTRADAPLTGNRQYHIALETGELAEYVLLVGDPGRVAKVASRWDAVELERSNREITTATGTYRGMRVSCMSTGMGTDNVEIVLAEVMEITEHPPSSVSGHRERCSRRSLSGTSSYRSERSAWRTRPTSTSTPDSPPSPIATWSGRSSRAVENRGSGTTWG